MITNADWHDYIEIALMELAMVVPFYSFAYWYFVSDRGRDDEPEETTDDAVSEPEDQENTTSV